VHLVARVVIVLAFGICAVVCAIWAAVLTPCGIVQTGWAIATFVCVLAAVWGAFG
jgi:hypothetical protein